MSSKTNLLLWVYISNTIMKSNKNIHNRNHNLLLENCKTSAQLPQPSYFQQRYRCKEFNLFLVKILIINLCTLGCRSGHSKQSVSLKIHSKPLFSAKGVEICKSIFMKVVSLASPTPSVLLKRHDIHFISFMLAAFKSIV